MIEVHEWAEIRRLKFVENLPIREISRRTGRHRDTIRRAIESADPPSYQRPQKESKLEPFKHEIRRSLTCDPAIKSAGQHNHGRREGPLLRLRGTCRERLTSADYGYHRRRR